MQYLVAYEIADSLRPDQELRQRYSIFHALTGCETVSSFAAHGKNSLGLDKMGLGCLPRVHWCISESRHGRTVRPPSTDQK